MKKERNPQQDQQELEKLGDEIATLSACIDATTHRLLVLLAEFDRRAGWNDGGCRSCAHWLSWRIGLDPGAAREKVRVARALEKLPRVSEALSRGEISYSKVRALTRVATPETEERLLQTARFATASQVERIVRGWRRADAAAELEKPRRQNARRPFSGQSRQPRPSFTVKKTRTFPRKRLREKDEPTLWASWPRAPWQEVSIPATAPTVIRSSFTSTKRCWPTRARLGFWKMATAFPPKRRADSLAMPAKWSCDTSGRRGPRRRPEDSNHPSGSPPRASSSATRPADSPVAARRSATRTTSSIGPTAVRPS
jgi:hypothetical protein